jgi:serine/threonine-protein kinase
MIESRPGDAFQPGELLNNTYRIEALLGRGGTSDVYKARSEISGRLMALKVLKAELSGNDDFLVLLTREEEMRDIRHDAVVRYSECSKTQDGHVYLLMDYVEGPGLDKRLKEGPMSAEDLLIICRRVAEGLSAAHQRKIVHRDLSPDNIILRGGDPAGAVIIDFGIAKDTNPGAETIVGNEFAGKYAYAAPEQLNGQSDARTDIYSLGALLLANFRGKPPDVGNNPMEVVQRKGEKLNTEGVPEPLKSLIDRMTDPDPERRFQSAAAVLAFLDNPEQFDDAEDMDATVITPLARKREAEPETVPPPRQPNPPEVAAPRKSRGGLVAALAVLLLGGGAAGGYFSGAFDAFLGPQYPLADPFALVVTQAEGAAPVAVGNVPSETMQTALDSLMRERSGSAELTLASGDIAESWADDVMETIDQIDELTTWRLSVSGNRAQITGTTSDEALHDRLMAALANDLPGALQGGAQIVYQPVFLSPDQLRPYLDQLADCGPLELVNVPATGFGPGDPVTVSGRVADTATRVQVFDALSAQAGERQVIVDVDVLNETLCLIEAHLPNAPDSGIDVSFRVGDRDEPNPSGRFFVGENPVIDVDLPAEVTDGYLTVSILDVSGNVYHLLPNLNREENAVSALRDGRSGTMKIRVAYPLSDLAPGRIAFRVDDSTLGKSKVIVLHSSEPLFDGLRPTSESASGYAEALKEYTDQNASSILSLDSRILTTSQP